MLRRTSDLSQETFHIPVRMQSNIKDFVRNYFKHVPKTSSFMQLKGELKKREGLQTADGRARQRAQVLLRDADKRGGVWQEPDSPDGTAVAFDAHKKQAV